MIKKIQYNTCGLLLCLLALGSGSLSADSMSEPVLEPLSEPFIVTSIKPLAIIAQSAVGDQARVEYLLPDNQSPHDFSLPVSALKKIASAELVVWIGPGFETRSAKTMAKLPPSKLITAMDQIDPLAGDAAVAPGSHSKAMSADPHLWLDPDYGNAIAAEIQARLGLPIRQIIGQDEIQALRASMAASQDKTYLSHHDAYDHFVRAFELPAGLSLRDARGSVKGVQSQYQLRKTIMASNISCIFVEPQYQGKDAAAVAAEFALPLVALDPQGLSQPLNHEAYSQFIGSLVAQFKACFQ